MLPLWSSYLVKVYAWKLILAKEGILTWLLAKLHLLGLLDAWLSLPVVGGNSLSVSFTGTFIVFVYVWLPFMTTSWPATARPRKLSTIWSRTGPRYSRTTAKSEPAPPKSVPRRVAWRGTETSPDA